MSKKRQVRSLGLIANFIDGYANGWHFAIGEFFRDQLDIKLTERKTKGKTTMEWTQGKCFCFDKGHIIYDNPKGYLQWNEALKHIKIFCEVLRATPNRRNENRKIINGFVNFVLKKPNLNKSGIEIIGQYHLSQNDFVEFLKTGKFDKEKATM